MPACPVQRSRGYDGRKSPGAAAPAWTVVLHKVLPAPSLTAVGSRFNVPPPSRQPR
jgi:hypothetical protein